MRFDEQFDTHRDSLIEPHKVDELSPEAINRLAELRFQQVVSKHDDALLARCCRKPADNFMIVTTSNMKSSDLGKGFVLKNTSHIDDILQPLIMTNTYLSIRIQIPTFHAGNVIAGETNWIAPAYEKHLDKYFGVE